MKREEFKAYVERYKKEGKKIFATSSFQTQSIPLLHMIGEIDPTIPVFCLNTGYLFPETLAFRDQLKAKFNLNIIELFASIPRSMQRDAQGRLLFTSDTDYCCHINKVEPLEPILHEYDIWISGVRADQSSIRKAMQIEQEGKHGVIRFHPMLDWNNKMIYDYINDHNLPKHPLENDGYVSIGCEPCTVKWSADMLEEGMRGGRWLGQKKTECGLHTTLGAK